MDGGKIEYLYDATGIKLKKKVTNGTTITTVEYMDGYQYTGNALDFFPHAEGYVKAIPASIGGGPSSYSFKYVFSYTDHLGNIRLKYAQDPSNANQLSILEEDHYYPYGLKHSGYSTEHKVFAKGNEPAPGIVLTPVNPFLGDSYRYKFGGKEYQDEFDINTYDFGARNYDPALGRWMNIDPLAEAMRRHSPYNYAFDNPVYFIDPDGMMSLPFGGADTGSFESYGNTGDLNVSTIDEDGNTLDSVTVNNKQGVDINADGEITKNNRQTPGVSTPPDYFDKDTGEFLGKGDTDEIRFISKKDWKNGNLDNYSTSPADVDVEAAVYEYYAKTYDLIPSGASGTQFCGVRTYDWTTSNYGGILSFNFSANSIGLDILNKFDAINIIVHELSTHGADHLKGLTYLPGINDHQWEYRATRAEVNHWSWSGTTSQYKTASFMNYGKNLTSQEIKNYYKPYGVGN